MQKQTWPRFGVWIGVFLCWCIPFSSLTLGAEKEAALTDPWPEGRGFAVGQTVPDLAFYDMKGNEVRFGSFLGKRYVLYCWASW
jgi:hypothetical protein